MSRRVLYMTPDGIFSIIDRALVPVGAPRSSGHDYGKDSVGDRSMEQAVESLRRDVPPNVDFSVGPTSRYPASNVVWVRTAHLQRAGWTPSELGVVQGTFHIPASPAVKVIPDWPKACPRCNRADSAVLLFQGWDCRHGCFK